VVVSNVAGAVTSAVATLTVSSADADGDGLPDVWEQAHGLIVGANDSGLDPDHDGQTNLQEFIAGTDPQDGASYLRVDQIALNPGAIALRFQAVSNKTYSVLHRPMSTAETGPLWRACWRAARIGSRPCSTPTSPRPRRFYRLITPALE
jgi:hypothetical protein